MITIFPFLLKFQHDKPLFDIKAMLLKATAGLDAQTKINVEGLMYLYVSFFVYSK